MNTENTDKLVNLVNRFVSDLREIEAVQTLAAVGEIERRGIQEVQAIQYLAGFTSRDLFDMVQARRKALRAAAISPTETVKQTLQKTKPVEKIVTETEEAEEEAEETEEVEEEPVAKKKTTKKVKKVEAVEKVKKDESSESA